MRSSRRHRRSCRRRTRRRGLTPTHRPDRRASSRENVLWRREGAEAAYTGACLPCCSNVNTRHTIPHHTDLLPRRHRTTFAPHCLVCLWPCHLFAFSRRHGAVPPSGRSHGLTETPLPDTSRRSADRKKNRATHHAAPRCRRRDGARRPRRLRRAALQPRAGASTSFCFVSSHFLLRCSASPLHCRL